MHTIRRYLRQPIPTAPLAAFRMAFGALMLFSTLRFWAKGWIETQYIDPVFHFPFVSWAQPPDGAGMYVLFGAMAVAALLIMLGLFYRVAIVSFFLVFTYIELIDKTYYLNHYYFVSLISFLLMWLPAHRQYSLDVRIWPRIRCTHVPRWSVVVLQAQLGIVYFFAGVAKVQPDWLLEALPLRIWLPAHTHLPVVGPLMDDLWLAYAFSWFGCVYDLSIPFFLAWRKTRVLAYGAVVIFHVATWALFPIGVFPWVMIVSTLIFFSPQWHARNLEWIREKMGVDVESTNRNTSKYIPTEEGSADSTVRSSLSAESSRRSGGTDYQPTPFFKTFLTGLAIVYFATQVWLPLRYLIFPSDLFWKEEGYRFSWRVMLVEKAGTGVFYVREPATGREWEAGHQDYLTRQQKKQMSFQPDMILQMAHHLRDEWQKRGIDNPEIYADFYVRLQDQPSRNFTVRRMNLSQKKDTFGRDFILNLN